METKKKKEKITKRRERERERERERKKLGWRRGASSRLTNPRLDREDLCVALINRIPADKSAVARR